MPAGNLTLHAKWTINQYEISFDSTGGTAVSSIIEDYDTVLIMPENPTREGYDFYNWFRDVELTQPYFFDRMWAENLTLYAKWYPIVQTLSFNSNGGTIVSAITLDYDTAITAPTVPTLEGNSFAGWYVDAELTTEFVFPNTMPLTTTLYAKWTVDSQTIAFESNGGEVVAPIIQEYMTVLTQPINPTRVGYTFDGWFSDVASMNAYTFPTEMPLSLTLYAKWNINSHSVMFMDHDGSQIESSVYNFSDDLSGVGTPSNPVREGYTFIGWDQVVPSQMPDNDVVILAMYEINQYQVTYFVDGVETVVMIDYNSLLANIPTPTKEGYEFVEWQVDMIAIDVSSYRMGVDAITVVAFFRYDPVLVNADLLIILILGTLYGGSSINNAVSSVLKYLCFLKLNPTIIATKIPKKYKLITIIPALLPKKAAVNNPYTGNLAPQDINGAIRAVNLLDFSSSKVLVA